jgi:hypothetical protein
VGQRDGGRDGRDPETATVLQVKFKRTEDKENSEWLIAALEKELPKIHALAKQGMAKYLIATNAQGTAHLGGGRIDRVQQWLDDNLPVPAMCMWRNEIDRRFDLAPAQLKLKYAELLTLEDGFEIILSTLARFQNERANDAMRSFIASQYRSDETVKFKQVNLSNNLLDLFIDVPVSFSRSNEKHYNLFTFFNLVSATHSGSVVFYSDEFPGDYLIHSANSPGKATIFGAADALLSAAAQEHLKLVVLEGAPGQGKSTLAQYICQVHRARYLNKIELLEKIPDNHKQTAFRLPVKVDLRDLATFLEGKPTFNNTKASTAPRSLEVFVSELISYGSAGIKFETHEVLTLFKGAPILLFFDGLDEIADVEHRQRTVDVIAECLARLREHGADVQVVVTSRPSVFGKAPSFSRHGFVTLKLFDIDEDRIDEYANKWMSARGMDTQERADVQKILSEKLEFAHIRDLTRNPMQLTILLSLIHQVGHSLPDQRTDLYRRYVDLFLTREADKSIPVREHRQLLIGFIEHLAWTLQSEAESSHSSGSISTFELHAMAREYLEQGSHSKALADDLFSGGLERIFVLVTRIEGLYEFEVQPLREFFCAQHLYTTSPIGTYRDAHPRGDRAQRFEAIAASPFWMNVCRFYAGFYESGEIGTLVVSLDEMIKTGDLATSVHARRVGFALLQDWVFSNKKYPQAQLIHSIFDELGLEIMFSANQLGGSSGLEAECGRDVLRDIIFEQLKSTSASERTSSLCAALKWNGGFTLSEQFAQTIEVARNGVRTNQIRRMFRSGASANLESDAIWSLITGDSPDLPELTRRISDLVQYEERKALSRPMVIAAYVDSVLNGTAHVRVAQSTSLSLFANLLSNRLRDFYNGANMLRTGEQVRKLTVDERVSTFLSKTKGDFSYPVAADGFYSRYYWHPIVENLRQIFGEQWVAYGIAIRVSGGSSPRDTSGPELFDSSVPLCSRARAARVRRGGEAWWSNQAGAASNAVEKMFWLGMTLTWASVENLLALMEQINIFTDALTQDQRTLLGDVLVVARNGPYIRLDRKQARSKIDLSEFSPAAAMLVVSCFQTSLDSFKFGKDQREDPLFSDWLAEHKLRVKVMRPVKHQVDKELKSWLKLVAGVKRLPQLGQDETPPSPLHYTFSLRVARDVVMECNQYSIDTVEAALQAIQIHYRPPTLTAVAASQDWAWGEEDDFKRSFPK